jgi:hypothetical protein
MEKKGNYLVRDIHLSKKVEMSFKGYSLMELLLAAKYQILEEIDHLLFHSITISYYC